MKMAKGFRKIDNQLWLALMKADLTRACYKVLLTVIHFTLGYNQRTDAEISLSTFSDYTDLSIQGVRDALAILQNKNIIGIAKTYTNRKSYTYTFNIDFDTWISGKADLYPRVTPDLHSKGKDSTENNPKTVTPDPENLYPRVKVATPKGEPLKKERKLIKKTIPSTDDDLSIKKSSFTPPPETSDHHFNGEVEITPSEKVFSIRGENPDDIEDFNGDDADDTAKDSSLVTTLKALLSKGDMTSAELNKMLPYELNSVIRKALTVNEDLFAEDNGKWANVKTEAARLSYKAKRELVLATQKKILDSGKPEWTDKEVSLETGIDEDTIHKILAEEDSNTIEYDTANETYHLIPF
jgi:phage replication O-like protein O